MSIAIYPETIQNIDLSTGEGYGSEFDSDCKKIHEACKGWGANVQQAVDALATKDATARYKMAVRYNELYDKPLAELMKKEFSGDFGNAMKYLSTPLHKAECSMLKKATDGVGCQVNVIFSILCGRTNDEMERIKKTYFQMYTKDLGKVLASELHGDMERIVFNCLQASEEKYDPEYHTQDKAKEDAASIYGMGQGRWGTDEKGLFKLLCASPPEYLKAVNMVYVDKYGYSLTKAMEKEMSGNVLKATLHMLGMKLKPYETIAALVKSACAGIGTDELLLTCCIIRYQGIMEDLMAAHIELYGKSIHDRVREETSGKYKTVLLAALNTVWSEAEYLEG